MIKKLLTLLIVFLAFGIANAQVGINTTKVDSASILEINNNSKGLLFSGISTNERLNMDNPTEGLTVYDSELNGFYYYHEQSKQWIALAPFQAFEHNDSPLVVKNVGNVGIGTNNPGSGLGVKSNIAIGTTYAEDERPKTGTVVVEGPVSVGKSTNSYALDINGSINVKSFDIGGKTEDDLVPKGTIAFFYGSASDIPPGWVICNGSNGTPNLSSGTMVAGADNRSGTIHRVNTKITASSHPGSRTIYGANVPLHSHSKDNHECYVNLTVPSNSTSVKEYVVGGTSSTTAYSTEIFCSAGSIYLSDPFSSKNIKKGVSQVAIPLPPTVSMIYMMKL